MDYGWYTAGGLQSLLYRIWSSLQSVVYRVQSTEYRERWSSASRNLSYMTKVSRKYYLPPEYSTTKKPIKKGEISLYYNLAKKCNTTKLVSIFMRPCQKPIRQSHPPLRIVE